MVWGVTVCMSACDFIIWHHHLFIHSLYPFCLSLLCMQSLSSYVCISFSIISLALLTLSLMCLCFYTPSSRNDTRISIGFYSFGGHIKQFDTRHATRSTTVQICILEGKDRCNVSEISVPVFMSYKLLTCIGLYASPQTNVA